MLEKEERVGLVGGKEDMVQVPTINSSTSAVLKNLFMVLDFLYRDNSRSESKLKFSKSFLMLGFQTTSSSGTLCVSAGLLRITA